MGMEEPVEVGSREAGEKHRQMGALGGGEEPGGDGRGP